MRTRLQVLHEWTRQVQELLTTVHATRAATYALFAAGIFGREIAIGAVVPSVLFAGLVPEQLGELEVVGGVGPQRRIRHLRVETAFQARDGRSIDRRGGVAFSVRPEEVR